MKDPHDKVTGDMLPGSVDPAVAAVVEQAIEDAHLAAEHYLIPVKAYVRDKSKAKKVTANNERQKRFVEKKKAEGLTKAFIPQMAAAAIKETGDFNRWLDGEKAAAVSRVEFVGPDLPGRVVEVEKLVEVRIEVPVPANLSDVEKRRLKIGRAVEKLTGWRRAVVHRLLK